MKAVGLVVEYNPFHNGHLHHLNEAKKKTGAAATIAVMSGQFLQRGEPALVDKWTRTKMALEAGIDIVVELPYVYSTGNAPQFAKGAIYLLHALCCDSFAFGSEDGEIEPFLNTVELIEGHRAAYNDAIQIAMKQGASYPQALQIAYTTIQKTPKKLIDLSQPNNILGFHYIEAVTHLQSPMTPVTIPRIAAHYFEDVNYEQTIASATGIRKALLHNQPIETFVPNTTLSLLHNWQQLHGQFMHWEILWPYLQYAILKQTPEQLKQFADVAEGIEYALIKYARTSNSFAQFMTNLKSKRYTWTRLQRMLTHIYTGVTKKQLHAFENPSYVRLLGLSPTGQAYISHYKKQIHLPIISRVGAARDAMLDLDIHASHLYQIGLARISDNTISEDYKTPPIRYRPMTEET